MNENFEIDRILIIEYGHGHDGIIDDKMLEFELLKTYFSHPKAHYVSLQRKGFPKLVKLDKFRNLYSKKCLRLNMLYSLSYVIGMSMGLIFLLYNLFVFLFSKNSIRKFLLSKVYCVQIGDCVASSVLRENCDGILRHTQGLYKYYIVYAVKMCINKIFIKLLKLFYEGKKYFINADALYFFEVNRRVFLSEGFKEIGFSEIHGQYCVFEEPLIGSQIARREIERSCKSDLSKTEKQSAVEYLQNVVSREFSFLSMRDSDVEMDRCINLNGYEFLNKEKVAIIYMHRIADAQYIYGVGMFLDIHDWLMKSIEYLSEQNINVLIKPHPAFFSQELKYHVDEKYLQQINKIFSASFTTVDFESICSTSFQNVFILDYRLSSKVLSEVFKNHLCITHHGNIAIEMSFLDHVVLCSSASPFLDKDVFVHKSNSSDEYKLLIKLWKNGLLMQNEQTYSSLLNFVYENKINVKFPRLQQRAVKNNLHKK